MYLKPVIPPRVRDLYTSQWEWAGTLLIHNPGAEWTFLINIIPHVYFTYVKYTCSTAMLILLLICINYFWYTNKNKRRNYFRSLVKPSTVFVIQRRCHAYSTPLSDATDRIHLGIRKTKEEWAATAQWRRGCWSSCCCVSVSLSMTMALFTSCTFLCIKHFYRRNVNYRMF